MSERNDVSVSQASANGSYGYIVVGASFLIQATIIGAIFSYSVFFDALHAEFGWSRAMISGAASLTSLFMGVWAMLLGGLNDRVGSRLILSAAAVLISCGYFLMSLIQAPWQLYLAYALFVGAAFAVVYGFAHGGSFTAVSRLSPSSSGVVHTAGFSAWWSLSAPSPARSDRWSPEECSILSERTARCFSSLLCFCCLRCLL